MYARVFKVRIGTYSIWEEDQSDQVRNVVSHGYTARGVPLVQSTV